MLLNGVKKGKRKRRGTNPAPVTSFNVTANKSAAEELRRMLSSTTNSSLVSHHDDKKKFSPTTDTNVAKDPLKQLEQRGRIHFATDDGEKDENGNNVILLTTSSSSPQLEREDLRNGSRKGKRLKQADKEMTLEEMVEEERKSSSNSRKNMDNILANNIYRLGSRYKGTEVGAGDKAGADEEDDIDISLYTEKHKDRLTAVAAHQREKSQQVAHHRLNQKITSKCWWWMSSSSFQKHLLLSLGDHVSLILTPPHMTITPFQCYMVPVKHSDSFVSGDEEVWYEVQRFRRSLRQMFDGVLFCETVLQTRHGLWQTRMNAVPVPKHIEQDAPIYFKSTLAEQAQEWGTHTKIIPLSREKPLVRAVPKGFSYFSVEWQDGGYAQIIESSEKFPKDFGLDTIASMLGNDPVRFNRRKKLSLSEEKKSVMEFVEKFKEHDWTLELDKNV